MKEIVIVSGKGGTGKTSITGAFAALAGNAVMADCDVDAADLHLILQPEVLETHDFSGGKKAEINPDLCTGCGQCEEACRFGAIKRKPATGGTVPTCFSVDPVACEGCGVCTWFCKTKAAKMEEVVNGQWFVSETRFGAMVHARLGVAEENSGKLVTLVRNKARLIAEERGCPTILVDGSPGIGCPVIASITGADLVVIVTEPTVSGEHDLERVAGLAGYFGIPVGVCVNKADINYEVTERIRRRALERGLSLIGTFPYDKAVTAAQVERLTIVEYDHGALRKAASDLWERVTDLVEKKA